MGTYTTNKNLFMPSVGETGWGTLVNENFSTIDTFLKPITVSGSTYTFTGNHVGNQSGGSVSATTGTFSGAVTGTSFNGVVLKTGVITVTPTNELGGFIPQHENENYQYLNFSLPLLPPLPNVLYSGEIRIKGSKIAYYSIGDGNDGRYNTISLTNNEGSLTFTNIPYLFVTSAGTNATQYYKFTLS